MSEVNPYRPPRSEEAHPEEAHPARLPAGFDSAEDCRWRFRFYEGYLFALTISRWASLLTVVGLLALTEGQAIGAGPWAGPTTRVLATLYLALTAVGLQWPWAWARLAYLVQPLAVCGLLLWLTLHYGLTWAIIPLVIAGVHLRLLLSSGFQVVCNPAYRLVITAAPTFGPTRGWWILPSAVFWLFDVFCWTGIFDLQSVRKAPESTWIVLHHDFGSTTSWIAGCFSESLLARGSFQLLVEMRL